MWKYVDKCLWQRRWHTTTDRQSALAREDAPQQYDGIIQNVGRNLVISPTRHQTKIWSSAPQDTRQKSGHQPHKTPDKNLVIIASGQDLPDKNLFISPTTLTKQKSGYQRHRTRLTGQKSGHQPYKTDQTKIWLSLPQDKTDRTKCRHQPHKTDQTKIWASAPQDRPNKNLGIGPTRQTRQKSGYHCHRTRLTGQKSDHHLNTTDRQTDLPTFGNEIHLLRLWR